MKFLQRIHRRAIINFLSFIFVTDRSKYRSIADHRSIDAHPLHVRPIVENPLLILFNYGFLLLLLLIVAFLTI